MRSPRTTGTGVGARSERLVLLKVVRSFGARVGAIIGGCLPLRQDLSAGAAVSGAVTGRVVDGGAVTGDALSGDAGSVGSVSCGDDGKLID